MDGGPLSSTVDASAQPSTAPVSPSTSSSPPDPVLAHYTALFARLLEQVVSAGLTDALDGSGTTGEVEEWHNLRQHLVETFNSPEAYSEQARAGSAVAAAQSLLAQFKAVGARRLAVECLGEDRRVLMDTEGTSAASCGTVEMLGWLGAVQRAALNSQYGQELPLSNSRTELDGPPSNNQHCSTIHNGNHAFYQSAPPSSLQNAAAPPLTLDPSSLGLPAYQNGSSSFDYSHGSVSNGGFAPAPARGAMPVKKKARPSLVASSSSNTSSAPPSKALAFANRMDDFNSSASSSHPIPSTSTAGPPSLAAINAAASAPPPPPPSFAPPPTAPKPKKPRSSAGAKPPRRTSDGVLKGRGVSEVYVPPPSQPRTGDSSRPQRKRKLPQHLTFEQSSDPMDEDEEPFAVASAVPAKAKGKARAKPTPPPQNPDEIDELASDYEEEVSQRSMSIDAGAPASVVSMPEEEEGRYPIGTAVMAKFPNYHFFPACILDPRSAPATTQGKRQKGSYLVKSIPTGADWRWILPEESHIRPITDEERAEIISGSYKVKPPKSWITWRHELVEAMELSTNPEALKDWASRPTDLEFRIAAERERKKAEKMISETGW